MEYNCKKYRYIVGIDLGTTNITVSYIDNFQPEKKINNFRIPQICGPNEIAEYDALPSFHFELMGEELNYGSYILPWEIRQKKFIVGIFAKLRGNDAPDRLITSAKSWLSHNSVDRTAKILPWNTASQLEKLSPIEVSARFLGHIKEAWNYRFRDYPLENQKIVLTVPASYDVVGRQLTVEAACKAGLPELTLLEEPLAAFYSWLSYNKLCWDKILKNGDSVLICDIGGGTTDFSVVRVDEEKNTNKLSLRRSATGEHLLLGGDNLDIAAAHSIEKNISNTKKITNRQWMELVRSCQQAKEILLQSNAPESLNISITDSGSRLIAGAKNYEISKAKISEMLIEGFLPYVSFVDIPIKNPLGFREFGLQYAPDPAISKYLAKFIYDSFSNTSHSSNSKKEISIPSALLLNGGFFKSDLLKKRFIDVLKNIYSGIINESENWNPLILENNKYDSAVSEGAAYFGNIIESGGIEITSRTTKSYYIGFEDKSSENRMIKRGICIIPVGFNEGNETIIENKNFKLLLNKPVEFPIYISNKKNDDVIEKIIDIDSDNMLELPPLRTILTKKTELEIEDGDNTLVDIRLSAKLTNLGTLEVWCIEKNGDARWNLEFELRKYNEKFEADKAPQKTENYFEKQKFKEIKDELNNNFGSNEVDSGASELLIKKLENIFGMQKNFWNLSSLRKLWELLIDCESGRKKNAGCEMRWLNLTGYALRPGYGVELDEWRVNRTLEIIEKTGLYYASNSACRNEWWILCRRMAGGLNNVKQINFAEMAKNLFLKNIDPRQKKNYKNEGKNFILNGFNFDEIKINHGEMSEILRMTGMLENIDSSFKTELGRIMLNAINKDKSLKYFDDVIGTIGHLGARRPLYGKINNTVTPSEAEEWIKLLLKLPEFNGKHIFSLVQLSRKTGDRFRDINDNLRLEILKKIKSLKGPLRFRTLIESGGELTTEEKRLAFGDSLPAGIVLTE